MPTHRTDEGGSGCGRSIDRTSTVCPHRRRGVASIWVAAVFIVIIGLAGLATDTAYVVLMGHQLQNVADAAALAAAQELRSGRLEARVAAVQIGQANSVAGKAVFLADGDIAIGWYDRQARRFNATPGPANAVRVVARRTQGSLNGALPLTFGPLFGVKRIDLVRVAIAALGGGAPPGLITLAPDETCALFLTGDVRLDLRSEETNTGEANAPRRSIQVNSDQPRALCVTGQAEIGADFIDVVGQALRPARLRFEGVIRTERPVLEDPLRALPEPTWNKAADRGMVTIDDGNLAPLPPGYYSGGIVINNGLVELQSGVYVLDGEGLAVRGNSTLLADGVMIFLVGTGRLELSSIGPIRITPIGADGFVPATWDFTTPPASVYEGISVFQARDNERAAEIIGTPRLEVAGILYLPAAHLEVRNATGQLASQVIAWTARFSGMTDIAIDALGGRGASLGGSAFLAE